MLKTEVQLTGCKATTRNGTAITILSLSGYPELLWIQADSGFCVEVLIDDIEPTADVLDFIQKLQAEALERSAKEKPASSIVERIGMLHAAGHDNPVDQPILPSSSNSETPEPIVVPVLVVPIAVPDTSNVSAPLLLDDFDDGVPGGGLPQGMRPTREELLTAIHAAAERTRMRKSEEAAQATIAPPQPTATTPATIVTTAAIVHTDSGLKETPAIELEIVKPQAEYGSADHFFDCMVKAAAKAHAGKSAAKRSRVSSTTIVRSKSSKSKPVRRLIAAKPTLRLGKSKRAKKLAGAKHKRGLPNPPKVKALLAARKPASKTKRRTKNQRRR